MNKFWFNKTSNPNYNTLFFNLMEQPSFVLLKIKQRNDLQNLVINAILRGRGLENG